MYIFGDKVTDSVGLDNDLWITSTAMFTYVVVVVNIKMGLECTTWYDVCVSSHDHSLCVFHVYICCGVHSIFINIFSPPTLSHTQGLVDLFFINYFFSSSTLSHIQGLVDLLF